jgi:arylamine N-acetyltransferase
MELHYSLEKEISLSPDVLFHKIVTRRRGGYCFELNSFCGLILQSLGFKVTYVGCRMANRTVEPHDISRWKVLYVPLSSLWLCVQYKVSNETDAASCRSHMAILVVLDQERYLVDVGCGLYGPIKPLLLSSGYTTTGLTSQQLKLDFKKLAPDATSPPVWIYSKREGDKVWEEMYAFADAEFFALDFAVLSYYTMKVSTFTKRIMAQNVYQDAEGLMGRYSLLADELWKEVGDCKEIIQKLETEKDRIGALEKYFNIFLNDEERASIQDSEFKLA